MTALVGAALEKRCALDMNPGAGVLGFSPGASTFGLDITTFIAVCVSASQLRKLLLQSWIVFGEVSFKPVMEFWCAIDLIVWVIW